ncbi:MAG TPA: hypothetical protein VMV29_18695, partial [Ktedonobacterales bacterium]|nr:hypothetical protein [Ktedonobacterales bacterium]
MTTTTPRRARPRQGYTNPADARMATTVMPLAEPDSTVEFDQASASDDQSDALTRGRWSGFRRIVGGQLRRVRLVSWALLLVALVGLNYFAYQTFRVPQAHNFQPNWYGAQWITTSDMPGNVIYVRKDVSLNSLPDGAFLTVQASQYVEVYVNGTYFGSTAAVFESGAVNRAFMFDLTPVLNIGENVIALRVETRDIGVAAVRAVVGYVYGSQREVFPSDRSWRSSGDALKVFPPYLPLVTPINVNHINIVDGWRSLGFDDTPWLQSVPYTGSLPPAGVLNVDPAVYEIPFPQTWLSSGTTTDGYFTKQFTAPNLQSVWVRLASDGSASLYINGQLLIQQPEQITNLDVYTGADTSQHNLYGISIGLYDITPYLRPGANTVAVHVIMSHFDFQTAQPFTRPTAMGLDLFGITPNGSRYYQATDGTWRVSNTPASDWVNNGGVQSWRPGVVVNEAFLVKRPAYKVLATSQEQPHTFDIAPILLITTACFLLMCEVVLAAELWRRRRLTTLAQAIDRLALGFLPALGLLGLLFILSEEPLIPNPFPFTAFWLWVLIGVIAASQLLIILTPRIRFAERTFADRRRLRKIDQQWHASALAQNNLPDDADLPDLPDLPLDAPDEPAPVKPTEQPTGETGAITTIRRSISALVAFLRRQPRASLVGWALALAGTFIGFLMASYGLAYEPYWQDELASLEVARGILQNGIPHLAPGFIYPKAEL